METNYVIKRRLEELKSKTDGTPLQKNKINRALLMVQDIENFSGLLHFTHPGNLEGILERGLGNPYEGVRYSYSAYCEEFGKSKDYFYSRDYPLKRFTSFQQKGSRKFINWDFTWKEINPLALMIDMKRLGEISSYIHPETGKLVPSYGIFAHESELDMSIRAYVVPAGGDLGPTTNIAFRNLSLREALKLLNKNNPNLENREIEIRSAYALKELEESIVGIVVSQQPRIIIGSHYIKGNRRRKELIFTPEQIIDVTLNRMNRVVQRDCSRIVPVYDNHGNLLWPKSIDYNTLKQMKGGLN